MCVCVRESVCASLCVFVCVLRVCMCVFMCVCVCMCVCISGVRGSGCQSKAVGGSVWHVSRLIISTLSVLSRFLLPPPFFPPFFYLFLCDMCSVAYRFLQLYFYFLFV